MPPRPPLQSSFSAANDAISEVICVLPNADNSSCRKRCLGEKRYRSMQEHIRRAHPEYYIPKLPATKESFELMINTPPHPVAVTSPNQNHAQPVIPQHSDPSGYGHPLGGGLGQHDGGYYTSGDNDAAVIFNNMQAQQRSSDEYRRGSLLPAASAAAALAQLHYHRGAGDVGWEGPGAGDNAMGQNYYADQNHDMKPNNYHVDPTLDDASFMQDPTSFPTSSAQDQAGLLPSSLQRSPGRPVTAPSLQRSFSSSQRQQNRPRKSSLSQQARLAKHERKRSKEFAKRSSGDRKAFSVEPSAAALYGKRWEDLIDAATSATEEEGSRDLTPIPASPYQSPQVASRTSVPPPFALGSQFQSFQASPLNRALTPPPANTDSLDLQPFASVDSSLSSHQHHNSTGSSGSHFNIVPPGGLDSNNTSPMFPAAPAEVQIYCAGCRRLNVLKESYACTNCICGLCNVCVDALVDNQRNGRMSGCPRCNLNYGSFKQFQLDLR